MNCVYLLIFFLSLFYYAVGFSDNKVRKFPKNFLFGAASSAYQVEGAWNTDDKGENIWDRFFHDNPQVENGDEASDSYHLYKRDVEMNRELGVDFYRFSISWSRILPTGFTNQINEKGLQYYDDLIDELLKYNIEPMITMYHFDLPQNLQDLGGWTNPLIITWFEEYARILLERYSSRVKMWLTVNQPDTICMDGYGTGEMAPFIKSKGVGDYICVKNLLLAHAKVYRMFENEYKNNSNGLMGLSIAVNWADSVNEDSENKEATEEYREFTIGLYLNPIFSEEGNFPALVREKVARNSKAEGFSDSRLPSLDATEIKMIKGSADFLGMNHYTTSLIKKSTKAIKLHDLNVEISHGDQWQAGKSPWLYSAPYGIYKALIYLNTKYNYPTIIITEHGWSTDKGLNDSSRVDTIRSYLSALLLAIEDGTEVKGYTAWSLMDNVEWVAGTSEKFGLYEVDFKSPVKTRRARKSALVYQRIIETKLIEPEWKPSSLQISISNRKLARKLEL